jgi:hypothetical protein
MKWDTKRRRYTDDSGRVLTKAEVRERIEQYIAHEQREIERQSEKLFIGALTVAAFFEYLRHKITAWHSVAGSTAYGGPDEMSGEQWSRINSKILSELAFLSKFEVEAQASFQTANAIAAQVVDSLGQKIPAGLESLVEERIAQAIARAAPSEATAVARQVVAEILADSLGAKAVTIAEAVEVAGAESLIGGTIPSRAQMYTDAAYSTYENNVAARETDAGAVGVRRVCEEDEASCDECVDAASDEYSSLGDIADIGSLQCLNNCRCSFEFSYEGVEPLTIDRGLTG